MNFADQLAEDVGTKAACAALAVPRATVYRRRAVRRTPCATPRARRPSSRALTPAERREVVMELDAERHADLAVPQVYARLLDEGRFLCSIRSMYRILQQKHGVRERRNQLRHPNYKKPELLATAPNQVWSWDITKLLGPQKWTYFHLYVLMDIFSRYVVGWMVATRESAELARRLVLDACKRENVAEGQLTVHSDRGAAMTSKPLALLYADLGVTRSLSRPHTSNDNPFSEAQFKTLKYRPEFPDRFGSVEDARMQSGALLDWYNNQHRHSSLGLLTPADVHHRRVAERLAVRDQALSAAYVAHPERFVRGVPAAQRPPEAAWINPPARASNATGEQPRPLVAVH
jgi:putative transposase